jgi:undecaprenyl diphosphate synthase
MDIQEVQKGRRPRHIAIIMDGNGRWAQERGFPRIKGHEEGAKSVRLVTEEAAKLGTERLTLYAFSQENWQRPETETSFLMKLLRRYLIGEQKTIMRNNIRFRAIGRLDQLPTPVHEQLRKMTEMSFRNTGMVMCLALSYGGRAEIVDAARRIALDARDGGLDPHKLDEKTFGRYLYDPEGGEVDLLIRTGGDLRISNFLLWENSYAEFVFTPVYWPDFREEQLHEAIAEFASRQRRFGGITGS